MLNGYVEDHDSLEAVELKDVHAKKRTTENNEVTFIYTLWICLTNYNTDFWNMGKGRCSSPMENHDYN